jgi:hypothetical protein
MTAPTATPSYLASTPALMGHLRRIWTYMWIGSTGIALFAMVRVAEPVESSRLFPDFANPQHIAFTAVALIDFGMALFLPKLFLGALARMQGKPDAEAQARNTYFVSRMVSWTIALSITVMGMALTVFSHSNRIALPFLALNWLSLLMNRANESDFTNLLRKYRLTSSA